MCGCVRSPVMVFTAYFEVEMEMVLQTDPSPGLPWACPPVMLFPCNRLREYCSFCCKIKKVTIYKKLKQKYLTETVNLCSVVHCVDRGII